VDAPSVEIQLFTFQNITDRIQSSIVVGAGIPRLGRNFSARRSRRGGRRPRLRGAICSLWLSACVLCRRRRSSRRSIAPQLDGGQLVVKIKQTSPEHPRQFQGVLRLAARFKACDSIHWVILPIAAPRECNVPLHVQTFEGAGSDCSRISS
jgi:hypothetical protein